MNRPLKTLPVHIVAILSLSALAIAAGTLHAQTTKTSIPAPFQPEITSIKEEQSKQDAQVAAEAWLKLIDGGKYAESWQIGSELFHKSITQDGWVALLKGGLPVFGNVVSRKLKTAAFSKILPGAPDGQYVVLQYDSDFANTKAAVETVATALDADGTWKIIGYHIK